MTNPSEAVSPAAYNRARSIIAEHNAGRPVIEGDQGSSFISMDTAVALVLALSDHPPQAVACDCVYCAELGAPELCRGFGVAPQEGVEAVREVRPEGVDEALLVNALAKIVRREMQNNSIHIRERSASAVRAVLSALRPSPDSGGSGFHSGPQERPSIPGGDVSS